LKYALKLGAILGTVFVVLAVAVYLVELNGQGKTLFDAFWFTTVTLTTVGYGDISPSTFGGRAVTGLMFLFSVGIFSFLMTQIQGAVAERTRMKELGMFGTDFTGHIVLCYWSMISSVALKELLAAGRRVAVITEVADTIPIIQAHAPKKQLFVTLGDATNEDTLERVNAAQAATVITASEDDTQNLITALNIRRINPNARLVVSTKRAELRSTLTSSGVTYVASPFELSGRLVASAAFEPEVALFIDDVTSGADDDKEDGEEGYDLQQFSIPPDSALVNQTVGQVNAQLKEMQGPLMLSIAKHVGEGRYKLYPHPHEAIVLYQSDSLIVLGTPSQCSKVSQFLGVVQGR
jgi:voltage-gated potassium channel